MILDFNKYNPIRNFGIFLSIIGILEFIISFIILKDPEIYRAAIVFIFIMSGWHCATGIGIIIRKRWGFVLLKFYLHGLLYAIPIGTIISKRMFKYIDENDIELFFGRKEIKL